MKPKQPFHSICGVNQIAEFLLAANLLYKYITLYYIKWFVTCALDEILSLLCLSKNKDRKFIYSWVEMVDSVTEEYTSCFLF